MFEPERKLLLDSLDVAHAAYHAAQVFGGPSLHFHGRALALGKDADCDKFAESVYALLTAWGMHRMGRGGSKMVDYAKFQDSLKSLWQMIKALQQAAPEELGEDGWRDLELVFRGIRCMKTKTHLVGNSKVMAHALPNLVPPIDREYTLRFLYGSTNITNGLDREWKMMQSILRDFFYPVLGSELFKASTEKWLGDVNTHNWNTSRLKIVDNLIIGIMKHQQRERLPSKPAQESEAAHDDD